MEKQTFIDIVYDRLTFSKEALSIIYEADAYLQDCSDEEAMVSYIDDNYIEIPEDIEPIGIAESFKIYRK